MTEIYVLAGFVYLLCLCWTVVMMTLARAAGATWVAVLLCTLLLPFLGVVVAMFVGCAGIREMQRCTATKLPRPPVRVVAAPPVIRA